MTNETKVKMMENRLAVLLSRGDKNIKQGGAVRKLRRNIRNLNKDA